jgi:uncharacterized protein (UPF0264 family)
MAEANFALSLKQPWAALVASGRKTVEIRKWATARRGRVLIHAARVPDRRPEAWAGLPPELGEAARLVGGIVGAADLTDCQPYRTLSQFTADRARHWNEPAWFEPPVMYGFTFANATPLPYQRCPGNVRFFPVGAFAHGTDATDGTYPSHPSHPSHEGQSRLLVSVRSVAEAGAALAGGAGLIDVKEPSRGSLGRADAAVIRGVAEFVGGRVPVSAAMGELAGSHPVRDAAGTDGLAFAKWGLAGCARRAGWRVELAAAREQVEGRGGCRVVAVAYADRERADAPTPRQVAELAAAERFGAFLLDTWRKDGSTLVDWLNVSELAELVGVCREAGVRVVLAGSLQAGHIRGLSGLRPDWFAVRGAACAGGERTGAIDAGRVRELVQVIGDGFAHSRAEL